LDHPGAEAESQLGRDLICQGRLEDAIAAFQRGIEADPTDPCSHLDLGAALRLTGRRQEAVSPLRTALTLRPEWPLAWYSLGGVLLELGDAPGAISAFRKTVDLQPDWSLPYCGLGAALIARQELSEAKPLLERALELAPDWHASAHLLAQIHCRRNELEAAITTLRTGLRGPAVCQECHLSLGFLLLTRGDYADGWQEYEWRWQHGGQTPGPAGCDKPVWDGSDLQGRTILVWAEQGLGDILQFVRFAKLVEERGGNVCLLSRPNLDRLLATCPGVSHAVSNPEEVGDFDCHIPLASLPRVLGITVQDLPAAAVPYLAPPERRASDPFGPRRGNELRVGIVWGVEPGHPNSEGRTCPLPLFRKLENLPDVELYSLQFGARAAELRQPEAPRAVDLSAILGDFADTAVLVEHLDLVVTVDTSMAHLAGALGQRVWTLVPRDSDWRWLQDREDTPWYPTMRLFRQARTEGWEPVMERVAENLQKMRKGRQAHV
jgi:tetratricopeptide (TPR) repeat protein